MIKRNLTSKITAAITSSAMLLSYCNLSAFANSDLTSSVFSYENYDITYSFTNHWSDKYQGSIFVKNTSEETIHDWCLAFVSDTSYEQIWNGVIENYDNIVLIHNKTYNQDILPGETVEVGFIETSDEAVIPEKFELISEPSVSPSENYSTEFKIEHDWETGYNASLTITNLSEEVLEDWTIEFDWDKNFDTIWDAEVVDHSNSHYVITNASYNQNIEPGGSVKIGLQSNVAGGVETQPGNVVLTEFGSVRRDTINTLLNVRNISMDLTPFDYSAMGNYTVKNEVDSLSGTIKPGIIALSANYSIETNWGKILAEGEFAPESHWTIPDIGFVLGMNKVTVNVEFSDGTRSTESEWFCNYNENNMKNLSIDESDPDEDGLSNYLEEMYGTDPSLKDTDGDGLTDYQELVDTGTNPLVVDTDNDGILDGRDDFDRDGIDTITEYELGTDPLCIDTDSDDLTDYEELYTYKTDPLNKDTDDDGADDKWEIDNGYDPLVSDTFLTKTEIAVGIGNTAEITVTASDGSASTLKADVVMSSPYINGSIPGYTGSAFDFSMDGEFTSAELKITFDVELLNNEDFYPVIYYFNEETQQYEEIETEWDGVSNYVTAKLQHFSTYILLNKVAFDKVYNRDIELPSGNAVITPFEFVFAIDSSASMSRNDAEEIRIDVAKDFIDKMKDADKAQVFVFDDKIHSYTTSFTSDKTALKNAISNVGHDGNWTYIGSAIRNGLSLFPAETNGAKRYLILLTDGLAQDSLPSDYVQTAKSKQVQIITIGLSNNVNEAYLQNIAKNTAPDGYKTLYYFAEKNTDLKDKMDDLVEDIKEDDPYKDSNNDGITDAQTFAFCIGKLTTSSGINPFGYHTFEEIQNDKDGDLDNDGIKNGDEITISKYTMRSESIKLISDMTSADGDNDNIDDATELKKGTDPLVADVMQTDLDWLTENNIYLSSIFSEDYKDSDWLSFRLHAGTFLFGSNASWVDDYEIALTKFIGIIIQEYAEEDQLEMMKEQFKLYANDVIQEQKSLINDINNNLTLESAMITVSSTSDAMNLTADTLKTIAQYQQWAQINSKMCTLMNETLSSLNAAKSLDESMNILSAFRKTNTELVEALRVLPNDMSYSKMLRLNKILKSVPLPKNINVESLKTGLTKAAGFVSIASGVIIVASEINDYYDDLQYVYALSTVDKEYNKTNIMLNSLIDNTNIDELKKAAKNVKSVIYEAQASCDTMKNTFLNDCIISGSIGVARVVASYLNPACCAVDLGLTVGNICWHTGNIDNDSITAIAYGELGTCLSKTMIDFEKYDSVAYYALDENGIDCANVLSQLRIVAEDSLCTVTSQYNFIHDFLFGHIKRESSSVRDDNNERIVRIADKYPFIHCSTNYSSAIS